MESAPVLQRQSAAASHEIGVIHPVGMLSVLRYSTGFCAVGITHALEQRLVVIWVEGRQKPAPAGEQRSEDRHSLPLLFSQRGKSGGGSEKDPVQSTGTFFLRSVALCSGDKLRRLASSSDTPPLFLQCVRMGVAPALQPLPYGLRLQPEHGTDRYEGEGPVGVITQKPLLGLARHALDAPSLSFKLLLKTRKCIFEYGMHQCRLWTQSVEAHPRAEKLCWEHTSIGQPFLPEIPVGRPG